MQRSRSLFKWDVWKEIYNGFSKFLFAFRWLFRVLSSRKRAIYTKVVGLFSNETFEKRFTPVIRNSFLHSDNYFESHLLGNGLYQIWLAHMCDMTWDMTHSYMRHDSLICETWLIHISDMTRPYVWHDMRHDSYIYETWLIHMWDVTHSYIRYDSSIRETLLFHIYDSFMCVAWFFHTLQPVVATTAVRDMIGSYVRHDFFIFTILTCVWHDSFIHCSQQ